MKNLKLLRVERGISQQKLADDLKINQQSINGYENRGTEPDIQMLIKLAEYFHTSIDYLVGYEKIRNKKLVSITDDEIRIIEKLRILPEPLKSNIKGLIIEYFNLLHL